MRFQIALTNVSFDNAYENVLRFETKEEQQQFFGVSTLFSNAINVNFTARNLLNTTAYFRLENGQSLKELLTKNYAIVKDTKFDEYYYYFINTISQDDDGQVHLRLQLDVFQTFYIDAKFSDCQIERANLNRFIDNNDGTVSFDGGVDSKLFEREPLKDFSQRLTKRIQIPNFSNSNNSFPKASDEIVQWLNENVVAWIYTFVDSTHYYKVKIGDTTYSNAQILFSSFDNAEKSAHLTMPVGVLAVPVLKAGKSIAIHALAGTNVSTATDLGTFYIGESALSSFFDQNEGMTYVWAQKVSKISPLSFYSTGINYSLSNDTLTITTIFEGFDEGRVFSYGRNNGLLCTSSDLAAVVVSYQNAKETTTINVDKKFSFQKNEIVGAKKQVDFNPKILSNDFYSLRVKANNSSEGFNYDLQKLNHNNLLFEYTEPVTPDISRSYARIAGKDGTCYVPEIAENFTGDVAQNDSSMVLTTSAYQTMLANNKNYFLQNSINRWTNFGTGIVSSGAALAMSAASGSALGMTGGILGALRTTSNVIKDTVNEHLTVDNLQSAPGKIQNAQGNVMLSIQTAPLNAYVEEYDCLPNEKKIANDYMDAFGFTYNQIDNVKNNDNIRYFHNYVKADISEMTGVSNEIRQVFVEAFARGVRFWNAKNITDKSNPFNYEMENYENWLAE